MKFKKSFFFHFFCLVCNYSAILFLIILIAGVLKDGTHYLNWKFITGFPSRDPDNVGLLPALVGSIYVIFITTFIAIPVGIGSAIFLEEYASKESSFIKMLELNITNLAGVPSIIYGILGLTLFVRTFGLGRNLLAGALTLSMLILPVIIVTTQESLRAVPNTFRQAGFALGMTRWEVIRNLVFPTASHGILTGVILSLSRAIGETAPLIMIGAFSFLPFLPQSPFDDFTVLPIQIFNWTERPQKEFHQLAASAILVLLITLITMNSIAIYLRYKSLKKLRSP